MISKRYMHRYEAKLKIIGDLFVPALGVFIVILLFSLIGDAFTEVRELLNLLFIVVLDTFVYYKIGNKNLIFLLIINLIYVIMIG